MKTTSRTALLLCAVALVPATSYAASRTETKTYYASAAVSLAPNCALNGNVPTGEPAPDTGIGGVCFALEDGVDVSAAVAIQDVTGLPVGGEVFFLNSGGGYYGGLELFCGSTTVAIPEGAATLVVEPDVLGALACLPAPSVGGTTGTITATISSI